MRGYKYRASILEGSEEIIFKLVCDRATPGQWAEWLRAPLEHAAGTGNHDLVDKLLRAGAHGSAGWRGCGGKTLLDAGVEGGNEKVVATLLRTARNDMNTKALNTGYTPLHRAVLDGKEAIAKMLMMAKANVSIRGRRGDGPLHLAIEGGRVALAEMLLLSGADANLEGIAGSLPINLATSLGQNELVPSLIQAGAKVNRVDGNDETCLAIAMHKERVCTVEVLLAGGADPNFANRAGMRVLHLAAEVNKTAAIPALVEAGAEVDAKSSGHPSTPLYDAAWHGSYEVMLALLELGANVNMKCDIGCTPLHTACKQGRPRAADLLLRWGADEMATDEEGLAPISHIPDIAEAADEDLPRLELLFKLLEKAPQDRAWRRRGYVVMCRAHPDKVRLGTVAAAIGQPAERPSCRARREQKQDDMGDVHRGAAGGGEGGLLRERRTESEDTGDWFGSVAGWLMALEDEDVSRKIIGFL